jgi:hypothetical protein
MLDSDLLSTLQFQISGFGMSFYLSQKSSLDIVVLIRRSWVSSTDHFMKELVDMSPSIKIFPESPHFYHLCCQLLLSTAAC